MPKKSKDRIDKEVDKVQSEIEKIEKKEIQDDYKKNVPFFIWVLKILIILDIIYMLIEIFINQNVIISNIISIILGIILLFALFKRKRWGWYYGLIIFVVGVILGIFILNLVASIFSIMFIFLLYIHKDYLNK